MKSFEEMAVKTYFYATSPCALKNNIASRKLEKLQQHEYLLHVGRVVVVTCPGVYVGDIPIESRAISAVSTSITAFLGQATRVSTNKAVRLARRIRNHQYSANSRNDLTEVIFDVKRF